MCKNLREYDDMENPETFPRLESQEAQELNEEFGVTE